MAVAMLRRHKRGLSLVLLFILVGFSVHYAYYSKFDAALRAARVQQENLEDVAKQTRESQVKLPLSNSGAVSSNDSNPVFNVGDILLTNPIQDSGLTAESDKAALANSEKKALDQTPRAQTLLITSQIKPAAQEQTIVSGKEEVKQQAQQPIVGGKEEVQQQAQQPIVGGKEEVKQQAQQPIVGGKEEVKQQAQQAIVGGKEEVNQQAQQAIVGGKEEVNQQAQQAIVDGKEEVKQQAQQAIVGGKEEVKLQAQQPIVGGKEEVKQHAEQPIVGGKEEVKQQAQQAIAGDKEEVKQQAQQAIAGGKEEVKQQAEQPIVGGKQEAQQKAEQTKSSGKEETKQQAKSAEAPKMEPSTVAKDTQAVPQTDPLNQVKSKSESTQHSGERVRYLIYLCDKTVGCYGFGDRQRALVSTYYLAELTNRRFGLIMTSPSNFRDFYEPNLVKWDIQPSDLPKNATVREIKALGPTVDLHLDKIDFNREYPEDILYIRTNQVFWHSTLKNPFYDSKIPPWGRIHRSNLIAIGWLRLMKPTPLLRASLNQALVDIATKMQGEADIYRQLGSTQCCRKTELPKTLPVCAANPKVCSQNLTAQTCCEKLKSKQFSGCPELRVLCSGVDSKSCATNLASAFPKRWDEPRTQALAHSYCSMPPPISKLNGTIDSIRRKQGFDFTDMNLMCAHIRLGHSKTFPFESVSFNKEQEVTGLWAFLRTYAQKGYHIYLAADAQEVKDEAKAIFGERLHMAQQKVVHIDHERGTEDAKAGFQFTLTEQLLLTTACREMVRSHSGYSGRAEEIRRRLTDGHASKVFRFHDGIVT